MNYAEVNLFTFETHWSASSLVSLFFSLSFALFLTSLLTAIAMNLSARLYQAQSVV